MTLVIISEYVGGTRSDRLLKHRKHGSEAWSILMEARINKVMKAVLTSRMTMSDILWVKFKEGWGDVDEVSTASFMYVPY